MEIFWSERLKIPNKDKFQGFLNMMSKRIAQGHPRYGAPDARKLYIKRLKLELKEYQRTGNMENLVNIANYAWLESVAPGNKKFHFNQYVESATRGKV